MNVIVDTSVWIHFFKGAPYPEVETALKDGRVYLTPVIVAELISGTRSIRDERGLVQWIETLPLVETPLQHWINVGRLRNKCQKKGLNISTPDAHIAQATVDISGMLFSTDKIFAKIPASFGLKTAV